MNHGGCQGVFGDRIIDFALTAILFQLRIVVLHMQANQHQGRAVEQEDESSALPVTRREWTC